MGLSHVVTNLLRKPVLSCLLKPYNGKVQDMLKIATELKLPIIVCIPLLCQVSSARVLKECTLIHCYLSVFK